VLVVDSNQADILQIKVTFDSMGLFMDQAMNGGEALRKFINNRVDTCC
jgi:CheY-like chemotaxis protein